MERRSSGRSRTSRARLITAIAAGAAFATAASAGAGQPTVGGVAPDIGSALVSSQPRDETAPQTSIDEKPNRLTKARKATFAFSSSEAGSTFECQLDRGVGFVPCSSPYLAERLDKGLHRFSVRAFDPAGNADATAATYQWKVKKRPKK